MEGSEKFSDGLDEDQVRQFVDEIEAGTEPMSAEEREQAEANVRGFFEVAHMLALRIQQEETGQLDPAEMIRQQEIAMLNLGAPPEDIQGFHDRVQDQERFAARWHDEELVMQSTAGLSLWHPAFNRLSTTAAEGGYFTITGEELLAASMPEDLSHTQTVLAALDKASLTLEHDLSLKRIRKMAAVPFTPPRKEGEEPLPELPEAVQLQVGWYCLFRSRFVEAAGDPKQALKLQRQAFGELSKAGDIVGASYARYREIETLTRIDEAKSAEQKATTLVSFIAKHKGELTDRAASALLWMIHERVTHLFGDDGLQRLIRTLEKHDLVAFMEANNLRSQVPDVGPPPRPSGT